jgi:hypothetical protein
VSTDQVKKAHTHTNEWCLKSFVFVAELYLPQRASKNGFGNRGERKKLDQPQLAAGDRSGLVLQTIAACTLFLFLFAERGGTFQSLLGPPPLRCVCVECHSFNFFRNKKPTCAKDQYLNLSRSHDEWQFSATARAESRRAQLFHLSGHDEINFVRLFIPVLQPLSLIYCRRLSKCKLGSFPTAKKYQPRSHQRKHQLHCLKRN